MLVSNSRGFVFIHIPKTGGDSVVRSLMPTITPIDFELGSTTWGVKNVKIWRERWGLWKHSTAAELSESVDLSRFRLFTVVRNPFDRVLSMYRYMSDHPNHGPHTNFNLTSLDAFVDCEAFRSGTYLARPQSDFVKNISVELFRLEDLTNDWEGLLRFLNLPELHLPLIHTNTSKADLPRWTKFAHRAVSEQILDDLALHARASSASNPSSHRTVLLGVKPNL